MLKRLISFLLALALTAGAAALCLAEEPEARFIPGILPEERYEALTYWIRNSEDKATKRLARVFSANYSKRDVLAWLSEADRESVLQGLHLLRLTAPEALQPWVDRLERAAWDGPDRLSAMLDEAQTDPQKAGLLGQTFYRCAPLRTDARFAMESCLYGDGRTAGIGYGEEEAASDAQWTLPQEREWPAYRVRDDGTAFFSRCDPAAVTCEIAAEYEGHPVTSVSPWAFAGCRALELVTVPGTVKSVSGFMGLPNLREAVLSEGPAEIGDQAFLGCTALEQVNIPATVTRIGDEAFTGCSSLGDFVIPGTVKEIGAYAFSSNPRILAQALNDIIVVPRPKMTRITLQEGVEAVGSYAFSMNASLEEISLPASLKDLPLNAFDLCGNLLSIHVAEGNPQIKSEDGVLFDASGDTLLMCPEGRTGEYAVPQGTVSIGDSAFKDCFLLQGITLPDTVRTIGRDVFYECSGLAELVIPEGVTEMGSLTMFRMCYRLERVVIPASVVSIGETAGSPGVDTVFLVTPGSYAEAYCAEYGYRFDTAGNQ